MKKIDLGKWILIAGALALTTACQKGTQQNPKQTEETDDEDTCESAQVDTFDVEEESVAMQEEIAIPEVVLPVLEAAPEVALVPVEVAPALIVENQEVAQ